LGFESQNTFKRFHILKRFAARVYAMFSLQASHPYPCARLTSRIRTRGRNKW